MGLSRPLSTVFVLILLISAHPSAAQESLGDAARRIRAEKASSSATNAPEPTASPKAQTQQSEPTTNDGEFWQDTFDSAEEAMGQGEYVKAETLYRKLVAFSEKSAPAPSNIAYAYDGLGSSLQMQRKFADSEFAYRTALQYWSKAPARFEEMTARSKAGLGTTLVGLNRYPEAEQLLLESVNTYHRHPEASPCGQAIPLDGLATLYRSTRDYSKGDRVYTETFALMTGNDETPCENFVSLLDHLAGLYADDNEWEKVEKVQQGANSVALSMQGPHSEIYGDTLFALAQTYSKRRRFDDAVATAAKAAAVFRTCNPPAPGKLAQSLEFQGLNLQMAGKGEQAKQLHAETAAAVDAATHTGDPSDAMMSLRARGIEAGRNGDLDEQARLVAQELQESKTLSANYQIIALYDSALLHQAQQKGPEAEAELKQVLALSIASTGASSESTAHAHVELGNFYRKNQRLAEAEQSYDTALSLLGPQDAQAVKVILPSLAAAYMTEGKLDRAETVYSRMLKNAEESHDAAALSGALQFLAIVYQKTNRAAEAEAALTRAMNVTAQLPKPMSRLWAFAALSAAKFYDETGKDLQAQQLYVQVISFMEKDFGPNNPALRLPLERLIALLKSKGQSAEAAKYQARCDQLPPMPAMPGM